MVDLDYRTLLDTLPDAIIAAGDDNRIVYINDAAERLLGWSRAELVGALLTKIMPERMRPFHEAGFARYKATHQTKIMRRPVRVPALGKNGVEIDIELTLNALRLGEGKELIVAALRDLRDGVELERQLGANRRISAQYEVMRVLAQAVSLEKAGPPFLEALGTALDWSVGIIWVPSGSPVALRAVSSWRSTARFDKFIQASLDLALAPGQGLPGRVWRNSAAAWIRDLTKDENFIRSGAAVTNGLHGGFAFPIHNGNEVIAIAEFFSEESREPDEELMRTAASIGGNVSQFLRRLRAEEEREALLGDLQRAVRVRDEFLSVASHELKTPLTPLLLKLDSLDRTLQKHPSTELTQSVQAVIDIGRRQVARLNELVGDLLDVSRIESGRLRVHLQLLDLSALIAELATRYDDHAKSLSSRLVLDIHPGIEGLFDRGRVEQVAVNLFDNALKYGRGGEVEIALVSDADHAVLSVKDYGIGIPADALDRIFERFERAVSDRHYGGLGLGLYITRTLVEAMGGSVSVQSEPGKGATFRVALPLHPSRP